MKLAKKFLPAISIDLEKNVIKTSFKRDRISLLNTEHAVVLSDKKIKHTHYKTSASESIISIQAIRLVYPDGFKRKEFEKTFELSKTTATRIINNWIEDNIIEKKGNGKVVVYKWIK
jgi:type IV secretory pathway TrbF-like protein